MLKKLAVVCLASAALIAAGGGAASAGEVTGSGTPTQGPAHAGSICAFSGLNDVPDAPFPEGGRVQSYGQLVRAGLKSSPETPSPGVACNGHTGFGAG
jgi:hypothetical protein